MKIAVWRTGHEIADTVAEAISEGLQIKSQKFTGDYSQLEKYDVHIAYGILRGMADIFNYCSTKNIPWFCADRGYWKPEHYGGFYRISLNGTQQTTGLDKLEPDYERWDRLGLHIAAPARKDSSDRFLICPPSDHVCEWLGIDCVDWIFRAEHIDKTLPCKIRNKHSETPLQDDLDCARHVVTFNSSVGWEALRQGIPVVSDSDHSFVGAYQKQVDKMSQLTIDERRRMFAVQASLQLTLEEIRNGLLWPLLQKLLASAGLHRS